ncbi:MAG: hypothetical protein V4692_06725, partial [Bdellovibrionota bacterium]
ACAEVSSGGAKLSLDAKTLDVVWKSEKSNKTLPLERIEECNELAPVPESSAVSVTYVTRQSGTSILNSEKMYGLVDAKTGKWLMRPFVIEKIIDDGDTKDIEVIYLVSTAKKSGKTYLLKTDAVSKKSTETPL